MKLSEIRPCTNGNKVLLFFENGEKIKTYASIVADFGLSSGAELSAPEYEKLLSAVSAQSAKERAVRTVSASSISKGALKKRLLQKGESEQDAENAVNWLSDLNLLDDRAAGENLVRSAAAKGYGKLRIREILRQKQIPEELWEELLSQLPPMDEAVDKLLRQKLKNANDQKEVQKAVNALMRYGHTWQDIHAGLKRMQADLEDAECQ